MGETRFRVMSNSLQWHQYEVVENKLISFYFFNLTMREYFFHNTNGNLRNRGEFARRQPPKVQKRHDLEKFTSFNFICNIFQNIT